MRIRPIAIASLIAALLLLQHGDAVAELIRIEVGAVARGSVPRTFEEAIARIERAGLSISWTDGPYYEPYYGYTSTATGGGATYGSISTLNGTDTVMVTWLDFDEPSMAAAQEQEILTGYGANGFVRVARDGRLLVEAYSHTGDPASADEVMSQILRR